ncbi:magnesium/cobalt transporter CorA [Methylomonas rivi]|uniref:Magnesium transport protein CorA n=1 Tax=Methylomonas rivi TaxID=2952226 RepID=A0ABT1U6F4_9GAMM|nr:magnesium/cobalt transporter CorA [Methylomonas sp. WSC-6]MBS4052006.1 magnesium/cobalt transporter CorA [Methylomonas sp.]MCQ8128989.1 magnesium/cobalt transporter CorA [Methylomonas sp. WSC-6]
MQLQAVNDLLKKHRLVESMVQNQPLPRRKLVISLVQKQHMAELNTLLGKLSPIEIGQILSALSLEDAHLVWEQVAETRQDDVLWEISDTLREQLVGDREPHCGEGQMSAFELKEGRLSKVSITCRHDLLAVNPIWIDLLAPTKAQRTLIGQHYDLELPAPDDLTDLEASARFYVAQDEIHIHSDFLLDREGKSRSVPVAFVLRGNMLFSIRSEELPVFRLQRLRARNQPGFVTDCKDMLLDLYGAEAEYSADSLEDIYTELEAVSKKVLSQNVSDEDAEQILADIAEEEDLNGRIRRNMLDTQRAVSFLVRRKLLSPAQLEDAQQILRDIESLNSHTAFLFDKINFLMDATVGFININQNKVIKIFSVASVAMLPPTLIASIYGMNFTHMPELDWMLGYPFALSMMAFSILLPYLFFRRKGWLR